MFTGLIEEVGAVLRLTRAPEGAHLHVRARKVLEGTRLGDSIAVNGACLTVVELGATAFAVDCMAETLAHTNIGFLRPGDAVNLERAMSLGDRLGGHLVLGHVDAVGELAAIRTRGIAWELRVTLPAELRGYVAPKGSVAVDGISLTVTDVTDTDFGLGIIPHTLESTSLKGAGPGKRVNLEADVLARYVRQALQSFVGEETRGGRPAARGEGGLTEESLRRLGF